MKWLGRLLRWFGLSMYISAVSRDHKSLSSDKATCAAKSENDDETGVVISVGLHVDDEGRTVLRAVVDFYDGNRPSITFGSVSRRVPVKIVPLTENQRGES